MPADVSCRMAVGTLRRIWDRLRRNAADARPRSLEGNVTDPRGAFLPERPWFGITHPGRARGRNEDAFFISDDGRLLVVADGMGGCKAGEIASSLAVKSVAGHLDQLQASEAQGPKSIELILIEALQAAHQQILQVGAEQPSCEGMGATMGVAFMTSSRLFTCHSGDVRCYLHNGSGLVQLTQDHSVVGQMVRDGQLSSEEARHHPRKNEVLQAAGLAEGFAPEVNTFDLRPGDTVVLCSDGLWEAVADEEVGCVIGGDGTLRQKARCLVDRANAAGGPDNITVVLYNHN